MPPKLAVFGLVLACAAGARPVFAQASSGDAVFQRECASCHTAGTNSAASSGAPTIEALRQFTPEAIVNALTNGKMQVQGSRLSDLDRRAVAEFLSGRAIAAAVTAAAVGRCPTATPMTNPANGPRWNGWGGTVANTRFQPRDIGGLTAADLPKLKLKWAFGYAGVAAARAQPTVAGGRLFAASENGEVHALDPKTGCSYWTFKAQAGVRTAISVAAYRTRGGSNGYAVYFGDSKANVYAVDANSGQQIWTRKVDEHRSAAITGAPAVFNGRVFVPVQGLSEEGQGGRGGYECCTFRGSVVALDASTGADVWKTYTIAQPARPRAKNAEGVQTWGPAGGGIWSAPTIDAKRRMLYVATGNGYADPPQPMTDAVIAMDLQSGTIKWVRQATVSDNWTMGCQPQNPDKPQCPQTLGPDFDFSASPALVNVKGRDLLFLPQKSGLAYALDPDNEGAVLWQYRIGKGSGLGGQWGGAVDGAVAYVGVADLQTPTPGGMRAIRLDNGQPVWSMPPQQKLCAEGRGCSAAQGGAVTAIPGAVLSGSLDGGLRAYAAKDGAIVWMFDTNREFPTVNGVKANGGGMDGPGPVVAGGMLFVNSGYGGIVGRPGNVLLAFGLD
jgi:polyvinyl alcohol dehydrogenase (cytochrome)